MTYGLIGEHLGHSFSPAIHERLSGLPYELRELAPDQLGDFLKNEPFKGINVTIPYKQAVIPYLDSLAPSAQLTGAVNAIVRSSDGRLTGHNTDMDGFISLSRHSGADFQGAKVVILGAGGAAKAVAAAASQLGAASVRNAVRSPKAPDQLQIQDVESFADCDILINATPVGMFPKVDGNILDISLLPRLRGVLDCIYNPLRTNLILDTEERGLPAEGGLRMLAAQAVRASELFRGCTIDDSAIDDICSFLLRSRRNIVLCGMPSSGKTTIGKAVAERLGLDFIDTDDIVKSEAGMEISRIFEFEGEEGFRSRESRAIGAAALRQGTVIATGGGAVLNPANVRTLKRSGILCFIDRPLDKLQATSDRPLSQDRSALDRMYEVRRPVYLSAADIVIPNWGTAAQAVENIIASC